MNYKNGVSDFCTAREVRTNESAAWIYDGRFCSLETFFVQTKYWAASNWMWQQSGHKQVSQCLSGRFYSRLAYIDFVVPLFRLRGVSVAAPVSCNHPALLNYRASLRGGRFSGRVEPHCACLKLSTASVAGQLAPLTNYICRINLSRRLISARGPHGTVYRMGITRLDRNIYESFVPVFVWDRTIPWKMSSKK